MHRVNAEVKRTQNKPKRFKQPYFNATMRACGMTLTYLRGGLLTCSVVWVEFEYFSLKFIKILMQLCKNSL